MKRVGAVICNFNKKEDVLNCIQSVLESKYTDYDLYVVDNASSDGSAEAIREKYGSQVTVLVNAPVLSSRPHMVSLRLRKQSIMPTVRLPVSPMKIFRPCSGFPKTL